MKPSSGNQEPTPKFEDWAKTRKPTLKRALTLLSSWRLEFCSIQISHDQIVGLYNDHFPSFFFSCLSLTQHSIQGCHHSFLKVSLVVIKDTELAWEGWEWYKNIIMKLDMVILPNWGIFTDRKRFLLVILQPPNIISIYSLITPA